MILSKKIVLLVIKNKPTCIILLLTSQKIYAESQEKIQFFYKEKEKKLKYDFRPCNLGQF